MWKRRGDGRRRKGFVGINCRREESKQKMEKKGRREGKKRGGNRQERKI